MNPFNFLLAQSQLDRIGVTDWHMMAFVCIAFGAMGYYVLQLGLIKSKSIAVLGIVMLAGSGILVSATHKASYETGILLSFCGLAAMGGIAFLAVRQPIYAALGFATTILATCGIFFMNSAHFIAAATMIVYVGATIIIFLFVLMFAQQESLETYELKLNRPFLSALAGAIFLCCLVYSLQTVEDVRPAEWSLATTRPWSLETELSAPSSTAALGRSMFTEYLFTLEIVGGLLLAATIGAIAISQRTVEVEP